LQRQVKWEEKKVSPPITREVNRKGGEEAWSDVEKTFGRRKLSFHCPGRKGGESGRRGQGVHGVNDEFK